MRPVNAPPEPTPSGTDEPAEESQPNAAWDLEPWEEKCIRESIERATTYWAREQAEIDKSITHVQATLFELAAAEISGPETAAKIRRYVEGHLRTTKRLMNMLSRHYRELEEIGGTEIDVAACQRSSFRLGQSLKIFARFAKKPGYEV